MSRFTRALGASVTAGVVLLALAGCSGSATPHSAAPAADVPAAQSQGGQQVDTGTTNSNITTTSTGTHSVAGGSTSGASVTKPQQQHSNSRQKTEKPGLRGDSSFVWSLTAQVTPSCVQAGRVATVTVQTARNAALAYVAVYNGEKSGAAPPFGYGYGGNANGYSSMQDGSWSNTWTIRADAPRGDARVTVVVASHQTTKQVDVPFTVVDPVTGTC